MIFYPSSSRYFVTCAVYLPCQLQMPDDLVSHFFGVVRCASGSKSHSSASVSSISGNDA